jgi:hypothetical protein
MKEYRLLFEIVTMLPVVPIYYYGRKVYSKLEKEIKIYWVFLLFSFAVQLGLIISTRLSIHNLIVGKLFEFIEYSVLCLIFFMWNPNRIIRFIILTFVLINLCSFIHYFSRENIDYSVTQDKYLRNLILIPLAFLTAYKFSTESKTDLVKDIKFWIIGGILVNVTLTSFTQLIDSYSFQIRGLNVLLNYSILTANTIAALMFIKGFICLKTQMNYTGS